MDHQDRDRLDVAIGLENLASYEVVQTNCMFQLAIMLPEIAVESCAESYKEEAAQALMGLIRASRPLPRLSLNTAVRDLFAFCYENIGFEGYEHWPAIKAPVAV